jgi:hypothetical protein
MICAFASFPAKERGSGRVHLVSWLRTLKHYGEEILKVARLVACGGRDTHSKESRKRAAFLVWVVRFIARNKRIELITFSVKAIDAIGL